MSNPHTQIDDLTTALANAKAAADAAIVAKTQLTGQVTTLHAEKDALQTQVNDLQKQVNLPSVDLGPATASAQALADVLNQAFTFT